MTDTTTTPPTGAATSSCPVSCPVCGQTFTPVSYTHLTLPTKA